MTLETPVEYMDLWRSAAACDFGRLEWAVLGGVSLRVSPFCEILPSMVMGKNLDAVKVLVALGADPMYGHNGISSVLLAIHFDEEIACFLIRHARFSYSQCALFISRAIQRKSLPILRALFDKGVDAFSPPPTE